jgi:flagellar hook-associated protein 3 FlgL
VSNAPVADYALYNGDDGNVTYILGEGTQLSLDADGRNIFSPENPDGTPAGINIFEVMADLIDALENDDASAIADQTKLLDQAHTQISEIRAANSPRMYQLETTEQFWSNYKPKLQYLLAKTQEVDLNEAVMQLKNIELAYQTTLATAARIIQPSLINFLK